MKFKWSLSTGIIIGLVLLFALSAVAVAVTVLLKIPGIVEIIPAVDDVQVYSSVSNEPVAIRGVQFASMRKGTSANMPLYVTNEGNEDLSLYIRTNPSYVPWGTITIDNPDIGVLQAGQSANFTLKITVYTNALQGIMDFDLEIYENTD